VQNSKLASESIKCFKLSSVCRGKKSSSLSTWVSCFGSHPTGIPTQHFRPKSSKSTTAAGM